MFSVGGVLVVVKGMAVQGLTNGKDKQNCLEGMHMAWATIFEQCSELCVGHYRCLRDIQYAFTSNISKFVPLIFNKTWERVVYYFMNIYWNIPLLYQTSSSIFTKHIYFSP